MVKKVLFLFLGLVFILNVGLAGCTGANGIVADNDIPPLPSVSIPNDDSDNSHALDARQYGAKGDGVSDDGGAIQQAINSCAQKGGGIVLLKDGVFLSSPIVLKSGVYLKVEETAMLKAIPYESYPKANGASKPAPLIGAKSAERIGILGKGKIDGNGPEWWRTQGWEGEDVPKKKIPNNVSRPYLVYFIDCSDIIVKDVTLQNSPMFNLVPQKCEDVVIYNVTIHNPANSPNTDAIDPSGNNFFIDHVTLDTGDDNIAIKGHLCSTSNVYITNSVFLHGHGLSIGSDFEKGVQNVFAKNCKFVNTEAGIRIKSARDRGGLVNNVHYSDFTMENVGRAIQITAYYPQIPATGKDTAQEKTATTPQYQNITISGIVATAFKSAGDIIGLPECITQDMTLSNVQIKAPKGLTVRNAQIRTQQTHIQAEEGPEYIAQENSSIDAN
ncbi:MAG: polygalacturonase [Firmicutes bacterium]|nr:polygalacturonase [Bacillota bacterium]